MPPRTPSTTPAKSLAPPRLPPLPRLRVRRPNQAEANPCLGIMSSVLSCWASSGYTSEGCIKLEQALRTCMDEPREKAGKKNTINYHLSRLYPKIAGPRKRGK